jgi:hypothetical protein
MKKVRDLEMKKQKGKLSKIFVALAATTALAGGVAAPTDAHAGNFFKEVFGGFADGAKAAGRNQAEMAGVQAGESIVNGLASGLGIPMRLDCSSTYNNQIYRYGNNKPQTSMNQYKQCIDNTAQYRQQAQAQAEYQKVQAVSQSDAQDYTACAADRRAEKTTTQYCVNVFAKVQGPDALIILPNKAVTTVRNAPR